MYHISKLVLNSVEDFLKFAIFRESALTQCVRKICISFKSCEKPTNCIHTHFTDEETGISDAL